MIRSDSKQDGTGLGGAYAFNALLALWLIVLGDDAYDMVLRSDLWLIHYWCLHGDLHKDKKKYLMMCLSYTVVAICIKIIYCRIVLGTSMDEDCWLGTWMIIQSCIVG